MADQVHIIVVRKKGTIDNIPAAYSNEDRAEQAVYELNEGPLKGRSGVTAAKQSLTVNNQSATIDMEDIE